MSKQFIVNGVMSLLIGLSLTTSSAAQTVEYIEPSGGYTQVVTVTDRGVKTIHVSGQVGQGDDYRAHVESAFAGVVGRLEQAGATVHDVVKMRAFVKDMTSDLYGPVAEVRRQTFPEGAWPASSVVGVQALAREGLRVEVEVVAVVAEEGVDLSIERFGPSNGFSGAVAVTAHGVKTVYISGQVGPGDGLSAQTAAVWERIGQRLEAAGASHADLVKTTAYLVNYDRDTHLEAYRDGTPPEVTDLADRPASTLLGIPSLANDSFLVEIDAVAVVGVDDTSITREFIDPAGSFTQVVTATGSGPKTVYISGQVGRPGDPLATQADQAYANLRRQLDAAGGSPGDLLKVTIYIPGYDDADLQVLGPARQKHGFIDAGAPASTLLGIQSLYSSDAAIEVEGVAVVSQ
jgi:enamine deaminase RidA (YjgF/YER057c/UK114 family)